VSTRSALGWRISGSLQNTPLRVTWPSPALLLLLLLLLLLVVLLCTAAAWR
jgi:hypothetical protein